MTDATLMSFDGIETQPLKEFTEKAYLDYSMYVILDRALPHIGDGLKPVQRRIVYAMSELGLNASAKYKKSARTVGDVLGKFHPHGDTACYEAMVLMAQPFSYLYPLVDGQGNWGSSDDPKSFAAMRYTESKLTEFSSLLLSELGQGTVEWKPNFDGELEEPKVLPSRVPHVLLNGGMGIAVGMATDIPPHNLKELINACIQLIDAPNSSLAELMQYLPAPDYPTNAEIISSKEDLVKIYNTGLGSVRLRSTYEVEQGDVVITALPHQVSGNKIIEQIAKQMRAKKLPMVEDLRDESDHENPTRLVIIPRSNRVDIEKLMLHLFATTDLEKTYRVNMNMVGLNGRPQVKNLLTLLKEWLAFRFSTVRRRLEFRLGKVNKRLHLLDALLIAFLNIDEVIRIVRNEEHPKKVLMERFDLTDIQANYVLDTRLRQLARLEEIKIRTEQAGLEKERKSIERLLSSKQRLKTLIRKELTADADKYGGERRCKIVNRPIANALDETDMAPSEPITLVLSEKAWIRAGKGHDLDPESLNYKSGDKYLTSLKLRSNQIFHVLDSTGRCYSLASHTLPSARSQGEPLTGKITAPSGASFEHVFASAAEQWMLLSTDMGFGFMVQMKDLMSKNKAGKQVLSVPNNAKVMPPVLIEALAHARVVAITNQGYMLVINADELPQLKRGKGTKVIGIPTAKLASGREKVIAMVVVQAKQQLIIHSGKRHFSLKPSDLDAYQAERGKRGHKLPRGLQRVERVAVE